MPRSSLTTVPSAGGKLGAALKLVAGFCLAAAVVLYVEALLAVFPRPVWTILLLLPLLAGIGLVVDSARRRRAAGERPPRAIPRAQPAPSPNPSPPRLPTAPAPERAPAEPEPAPEEATVAAAIECFNTSPFPRTVAGIAKSLGPPQVSVLPADEAQDVLITVAWELTWYQYRANPRAPEPVLLEERGQELEELAEPYQAWNAEVDAQGRLAVERSVATSP